MGPHRGMGRSIPGVRMVAPLLLVSSMSAPMQCGSDPDPSRRLEETPAEALLLLADEFERSGDRDARIRTLRFIVQRHPKTRQAEDARVTLQQLGVVLGDSSELEAAPSSSSIPAITSAQPSADTSADPEGEGR
jgi:hypothetical protein